MYELCWICIVCVDYVCLGVYELGVVWICIVCVDMCVLCMSWESCGSV